MDRRKFVRHASLASAGFMLLGASAFGANDSFPVVRVPVRKRNFRSQAIEDIIEEMQGSIANKELGWLFGNCFPNTLDTTVEFEIVNGKPDTYVITGDIDAMWLRDSSAQVWPYIAFCNKDEKLKQLIAGVINRQTKCIIKDPYANAFYKNNTIVSPWHKDDTDMKSGIHERKWEIDSLCYPIRLAYGYYSTTGDKSPFDEQWVEAMKLVVKTFKTQQRKDNCGPYRFMRSSPYATDSVPMDGYGYPAKPNGLICSMFRPSDDATIYPYLVPSNIFALDVLKKLKAMLTSMSIRFDFDALNELIADIDNGLQDAIVRFKNVGDIYAYEINGYGSHVLMDDANVPSLLSLGYLIPEMKRTEIYKSTRKFVLSSDNPFFFKGRVGEGVGGPHAGLNMIWPLGITMRGLTSENPEEIQKCIQLLLNTHADTGFMHEAFNKDDAKQFSRPWFAWANTLFGEFILHVNRKHPELLG